ncbi:26S proteasome regulatory particle non-ATPase subunit8 [Neoconidiobolus thromboides FSU 785]|nr:26S proteasome regulatory particle non-ATPase subunit8 [Neoconidiobolus thromboides FSU 785]
MGENREIGLLNISAPTPTEVIVHPLVLLSVVDHYNRSAKNTRKRVVGILLGQFDGGQVNVANSFAVPFEEDEKDPSVWFLDHNYVENMDAMFRKVNAKEKMIGWYHTGPKLRSSDLMINDLFKRYTSNPVLIIVDVKPTTATIPINAYFSVEEILQDGKSASKTFTHIPSSIGAEEAEEIGVEHLLRDIKDNAVGSLSTRLTGQVRSLQGLHNRLTEISNYIKRVEEGALPPNQAILTNLQTIFSLLPNIDLGAIATSITRKTNDHALLIYLASLVRSIIALHNLIDNKVQNHASEFAELTNNEEVAPAQGQ